MQVKYNVQAPPKGKFNGASKSEEVKAIEDFLHMGRTAKNMCFKYDNPKEAKSKQSTISRYRRKYNETHPKGYDFYRIDNCIYIVRLAGKEGKK